MIHILCACFGSTQPLSPSVATSRFASNRACAWVRRSRETGCLRRRLRHWIYAIPADEAFDEASKMRLCIKRLMHADGITSS